MAAVVNGKSVCSLVHEVVTTNDDAATNQLVKVIQMSSLTCLHEKCAAAFTFVCNTPDLSDAKIAELTKLLIQKEKERPRSIIHFDSGGSIASNISDSD